MLQLRRQLRDRCFGLSQNVLGLEHIEPGRGAAVKPVPRDGKRFALLHHILARDLDLALTIALALSCVTHQSPCLLARIDPVDQGGRVPFLFPRVGVRVCRGGLECGVHVFVCLALVLCI